MQRAIKVRRSVSAEPASQIKNTHQPSLQGGEVWPERKMDFAQQNTERAMQGTEWMRAIAEQNLNQSKAALEEFLTISRNAVCGVDRQAAAICENSFSLAEETLSNTFDFANKLVRMKEPQEFAHIQSEFLSRQAQLLGDQTRELFVSDLKRHDRGFVPAARIAERTKMETDNGDHHSSKTLNKRETSNLIGSDKVEGTPVYRTNGDRVGQIERVMIDKFSGKVAYAVMRFGGFLGIGEDHYPLPWFVLTYNPTLGVMR